MITAFITRLPFKQKKNYKHNDIQQRYSNDKNDVERSERIKSTYKVNYNVTERKFLFPIYFDAIIFFLEPLTFTVPTWYQAVYYQVECV